MSGSDAEIKANSFGMTDVKVSVRLGREAGLHFSTIFTFLQILLYCLFNKVQAFLIACVFVFNICHNVKMLTLFIGYKSRTFFLFYWNITALFYNLLSFGRKNEVDQRSYLLFVLHIIIVIKGADNGISFVRCVLHCRGGVVASVI